MSTEADSNPPWTYPMIGLGAVAGVRLAYFQWPFITGVLSSLMPLLILFLTLCYFSETLPYVSRRVRRPGARIALVFAMAVAPFVVLVYLVAVIASGIANDPNDPAAVYRDQDLESEVQSHFAECWSATPATSHGRPASLDIANRRILFVEHTPAKSYTISDINGIESLAPETDVFSVPPFQYDLPAAMRAHSISEAAVIIRIQKGTYQAPNIHLVTEFKGDEVNRSPVFVPELHLDIWDKSSATIYRSTFKAQKFYQVPGTAIGGAPEPKNEMFEWLGLPLDETHRLGPWQPEIMFAGWIRGLWECVF
ncbi:MAG: hypothetical protein GXY55_09015 [Phycisphaerae bacterium]|nr:hypothetical protein [Phycisphaerae bacterium]